MVTLAEQVILAEQLNKRYYKKDVDALKLKGDKAKLASAMIDSMGSMNGLYMQAVQNANPKQLKNAIANMRKDMSSYDWSFIIDTLKA